MWHKITKPQDNQQSTACYAFSRKAMKFYIDEMNNRFIYADGVFLNFLWKDFDYYDTNYLVVYNDVSKKIRYSKLNGINELCSFIPSSIITYYMCNESSLSYSYTTGCGINQS